MEVIPPKDVELDTFLVKTTLSRQIFPEELTKSLLGIPMDPILNFGKSRQIESAVRNVYSPPPWCKVFELWLFVLRHVARPQNPLYLSPYQ